MDRKLCVLIYSTFSTESKRLIEYIRNLPYDLAALTGMTFLCADNGIIREKLLLNEIQNVPCLLLRYFNGNDQLLENEDVYKFIASISQSIFSPQQPPTSSQIVVPSVDDEKDENNIIVTRKDVMSTAMEMQKSRENGKDLDRPKQQRTQLFPTK